MKLPPLVLSLGLAALVCGSAAASRAPTAAERSKIALAIERSPRVGRQNSIVVTAARVSSRDARWAEARFTIQDAMGRRVDAPGAILERSKAKASASWRVLSLGSLPLDCATVPPKVRADLLSRTACRR
ncbi:MAG TPA: hypothetical protein VGM80_15390 [Gaiellaceae bacterium]